MDGVTSTNSAGANEKEKEETTSKNVTVLAATNRPQDLDEALRRRLEKRIYISLPEQEGRKQLFKINLRGIAMDDKIDWDKLVNLTKGYSGADIANVCRDAAMIPLRKKIASGGLLDFAKLKEHESEINAALTMDDFMEALKNVQKSVS